MNGELCDVGPSDLCRQLILLLLVIFTLSNSQLVSNRKGSQLIEGKGFFSVWGAICCCIVTSTKRLCILFYLMATLSVHGMAVAAWKEQSNRYIVNLINACTYTVEA